MVGTCVLLRRLIPHNGSSPMNTSEVDGASLVLQHGIPLEDPPQPPESESM